MDLSEQVLGGQRFHIVSPYEVRAAAGQRVLESTRFAEQSLDGQQSRVWCYGPRQWQLRIPARP